MTDNFVRRKQWQVISKLIKRRDNHKCQRCGSANGNYELIDKQISKTVLQVVHLNGRIDDNREDNLLTMCQHCALKHFRGDDKPTQRSLF